MSRALYTVVLVLLCLAACSDSTRPTASSGSKYHGPERGRTPGADGAYDEQPPQEDDWCCNCVNLWDGPNGDSMWVIDHVAPNWGSGTYRVVQTFAGCPTDLTPWYNIGLQAWKSRYVLQKWESNQWATKCSNGVIYRDAPSLWKVCWDLCPAENQWVITYSAGCEVG